MSTSASIDHPKYDPKNMLFRRLGNTGLRVPVFAYGGWLTVGGQVKGDPVKDLMKTAFEAGINMFDNAEVYSKGQSEIEMGRVIKELNWRRSDVILTTKIFWGAERKGPNDQGLSRKHIIEGLKDSLERLQVHYVDVVFAHRYDPTVPMEEIVRAFNWCIDKGYAFYWGTSEWSAAQIEEAYQIAEKLGLQGPVADQCEHHMLHRERPEGEYAPLFAKHKMGTTVWSPLAGGVLTGKYNNGIPEGSRFDSLKEMFKDTLEGLTQEEGVAKLEKVKTLSAIAEKDLNCSMAQLALAWLLKNENVSTILLGASKPEQILDNIKALDVVPKLTPEILSKVEDILQNKPGEPRTYGRKPLDATGRKAFF